MEEIKLAPQLYIEPPALSVDFTSILTTEEKEDWDAGEFDVGLNPFSVLMIL